MLFLSTRYFLLATFMLKWYCADLHIHTCLSPCGDLTLSPKRIIEKAKNKKLNMIGICDHNSAENVQYAINATDLLKNPNQKSLKVLPGMEICTKEEVHILGLFDGLKDVIRLQEFVYENLPAENNTPEIFGEQIIANEFDGVEGYNDRLLIGASNLTTKEIVDKIHKLNGIAIASHIDRESYSLIGQLGFIPEDLGIEAVEISPNITLNDALKKFPEIERFPIVRSSDAHFLEDIGKAITNFLIEEPTIEEIKMALKNERGRKYKTE
ncbi:MAG: PHP domain-containing protein [bacterium]